MSDEISNVYEVEKLVQWNLATTTAIAHAVLMVLNSECIGARFNKQLVTNIKETLELSIENNVALLGERSEEVLQKLISIQESLETPSE